MTSLKEHLKRVRELIEAARNKTGFHEPILNELSALEAAMQRVQQAEREKSQGLREALISIIERSGREMDYGSSDCAIQAIYGIAHDSLAKFNAKEGE